MQEWAGASYGKRESTTRRLILDEFPSGQGSGPADEGWAISENEIALGVEGIAGSVFLGKTNPQGFQEG